MFLRQLHLIVAALTGSLSAICSYLYQVPLFKGVAILGLLWSIYACYKILSFNLNSDLPAEKLINKENFNVLFAIDAVHPNDNYEYLTIFGEYFSISAIVELVPPV